MAAIILAAARHSLPPAGPEHESRRARRADQGLGPRTRFPEDRHRGDRPRRGRDSPARLARRRTPRRDGVHAAPRRAARATGGAGARHGARDLGAHGLLAGRRRPGRSARRPGAWLRVALRRRPRLPQGRAQSPRPARGPSRYAVGRDYHKVVRNRLARLADRISAATGALGYRAFTDSAPILEKALARDAGLGWTARGSSSARSSPTCRCRPTRP